MLKNNFKIALRNLLRKKVYTFINVMGLAVGVASCLLIVLFIRNEFSYDTFFQDHDRIYRMVLERKYPNHSTYYAIIPASYEEAAKHDLPEIEKSTQAFRFTKVTLAFTKPNDELIQFDEDLVLLVDSSFLDVFSFNLVAGNREQVLKKANEMVVTRELANRYFGEADPIGQVIRMAQQDFKVVGVCEDFPDNTHFNFSALVSASTFPFTVREDFVSFSNYTYFKLKPGADPKVLQSKIPQLVDTYASAQIERDLGKSWEDYKKEGNGYRYFLQPVASIHLDPINLEAEMKAGGNINSVYIMIGVALLILVIACINFMNLSTARSAERAREVGIRKVMGSVRKQLMLQFLTEAFLLSAAGVFLALVLVNFAMPFFNNLIGQQLELPVGLSTFIALAGLAALVGLLAGIYPAFVLSSFNPVVVMKGKFTGNQKGKWIRNGLVVFQFWISIILIIGTLVIGEQMEFMRNKSLGFDKEQMLVVERGFNLEPQQSKTLINEIRQLPEVERAGGTFAIPGKEDDYFGIQFQPEGSSEILTTKSMVIGDGFPETLEFELLEGRWFSEETNDSLSVLLNETAVKVLGLDDPIGKKLLQRQQQDDKTIDVFFTITGIVKDFNFISLREQITPLVLQSNELFNGGLQYIVMRIKPDQVASAISSVETKWKSIVPAEPFKFSFLDQNLDQQYRAEQQTGKLFSVFSGLAIFVACIGLFALSAYTTSLRTKEIGVRKVLGASVSGVVFLLSKEFTRMILLAYILAVPLAWYFMEHWWLQNFAYRIQISFWILAVAGGIALLIAWLTVSYQSIRAATADPVKSLRYE